MSAKVCSVEQREPSTLGRATITLGIGPHFSFIFVIMHILANILPDLCAILFEALDSENCKTAKMTFMVTQATACGQKCHHVTASNPASCVYVVTAMAKQWVYVNF